MSVTYATEIDCPPEILWSYLDDAAKIPLWMKGLRSVEPECDGPRVPGSVAGHRIKEGARVADYRSTLVAREPFTHLAVDVTGKSFEPATMAIDYRLTDLGGRTRLVYTCAFKNGGFLMTVMMSLFGWLLKGLMTRSMRTLKRLAEEEAGRALVTR